SRKSKGGPVEPVRGITGNPKKITFTQKKILAAYSSSGSISRAVVMAGVGRSTHYQAIKRSAHYRAAFEQAQEEFLDLLRDAATHRAVRGVKRKKFYRGLPCMVPVYDQDGRPVVAEGGEPIME